ncbi:MAG: hypothetical protein AB8F95_20140 [Bacteroidia bacterium]
MPIWLIVTIVIGLGILVALYFLSKLRQKRSFEAFAKSTSLTLTKYNRPADFTLKGEYKGYPVTVSDWTAPQAPDVKKQAKENWLRVDVPLSNPNQKFLCLAQGLDTEDWFELFVQPDTITFQHDLGDAIAITASDMWFASFVLEDDVMARAKALFDHAPKALIAIQGDALFAILPNTITNTQAWKPIAEAMTFLTDIKNALNK